MNKKTKNLCLKRLSKPQYFFFTFFPLLYSWLLAQRKLLALFVYITFQYLIYYL